MLEQQQQQILTLDKVAAARVKSVFRVTDHHIPQARAVMVWHQAFQVHPSPMLAVAAADDMQLMEVELAGLVAVGKVELEQYMG